MTFQPSLQNPVEEPKKIDWITYAAVSVIGAGAGAFVANTAWDSEQQSKGALLGALAGLTLLLATRSSVDTAFKGSIT